MSSTVNTVGTILANIAGASLKTLYGEFDIFIFQNGKDQAVALTKGELLGKSNVLCRIHSQCVTAHDFFSTSCDCREQMARAQQLIQEAGTGIIIFLEQEGRGNGLAAHVASLKVKAEQNLTQDAAYEAVGFPKDNRNFYTAVHVLNRFGIKSVKLITANEDKAKALRQGGVEVTQFINYTGTTLVIRRGLRIIDIAKPNAYVVTKKPDRRRFFIFGDINVDEVINHGNEIVKRGIIYVEPERRIGGTAYNAATALVEKGYDVVLYGRVGDDSDGDFVRKELERAKLTAILFQSEKPTGTASLHYFGEKSPERLVYHTSNSANDEYEINDVRATLDFYKADAHDFIFLPCHIFQRERNLDTLRSFFKAIKSHNSRLIMDLVPHDLLDFVSAKTFLSLAASHVHMLVTELTTLLALLEISNETREPTDSIIRKILRKLPVSIIILRFGIANISKQWVIKRISHGYEILDRLDDTGFLKEHRHRRGFGDRLMADAFDRLSGAIF
jgi:GTP cyclohydrolase II